MNGHGKFTAADQRQYIGMYKDSQFNGKGFYKWPDGRTYSGFYVRDKKEGFGIYSWPDGKQYQGFWANGLQDGIGRFKNTKGQSRVGRWQEGKRIDWIKELEEEQALKQINIELSKLEAQAESKHSPATDDLGFQQPNQYGIAQY